MSTHNLCFEQKYEKYQIFSSENFHVLVVKISVYLNRRVFVMQNYQSSVFLDRLQRKRTSSTLFTLKIRI